MIKSETLIKYIIIIILFLFIITPTFSQNSDSLRYPKLKLELPLFDLPYQLDASKTYNNGKLSFKSFFQGYANPSMHLSLDLTADLYSASHYEIYKLFHRENNLNMSGGKRFLYTLSLIGTDFILNYAPLGDGWEHEEYHRAIMTRFHVNSFNEMNTFPIGAEAVSVDHVTDEDLIRFKLESPTDFNRMHVAGIEGKYLLIDRLERNNFYYKQKLPNELYYLFTTLNAISYVVYCSIPSINDRYTDEFNIVEESIEQRDFTGFDFTGWTYDIFRPNENYALRGMHTSGVGINRYIKTTDLKPEELTYLKNQGKLQLLNMLSPMLFGIKEIKLTNDLYGNFSVHHFLTSFGNDIVLNVLLKNSYYNTFFAFHNYQNYTSYFPAIEGQLVDYNIHFQKINLYCSPRIIVGFQPKEQQFKSDNMSLLGLAECKFELRTKSNINPFIEFSEKTKGWIAGNEFLTSNFSCRLGISARFYK